MPDASEESYRQADWNPRPLRVFASAGEPSGDSLLAEVLAALHQRYGNLQVIGLGGPLAQRYGLESISPLEKMAVNGVTDVLRQLPFLWKTTKAMQRMLRDRPRPDLVLLIDYPGLNLRLLKICKALNLAVHYWAPPQIGLRAPSWKRERHYQALFKGVSVQVLFEDEAEAWRKLGTQVTVGHPFSIAEQNLEKGQTATRGLLLCPGSRKQVMKRNLNAWLPAIEKLSAVTNMLPRKGITNRPLILTPLTLLVAPGMVGVAIQIVEKLGWTPSPSPCEKNVLKVIYITEDKSKALSQTENAICFPGTMSLELALAGIPTLLVGVLDPITYWIGKRLISSRWLALPNRLLGKEIFPEWVGLNTQFQPQTLENLWQKRISKPHGKTRFAAELKARLGPPRGAQIALKCCEMLLKSQITPTKTSPENQK